MSEEIDIHDTSSLVAGGQHGSVYLVCSSVHLTSRVNSTAQSGQKSEQVQSLLYCMFSTCDAMFMSLTDDKCNYSSTNRFIAGQRDETQPVSQELVAENRGVGFKLDPVNGNGRGLRDHHSPDGVSHREIRVLQLELDILPGQLGDRDTRLVGVRHFGQKSER